MTANFAHSRKRQTTFFSRVSLTTPLALPNKHVGYLFICIYLLFVLDLTCFPMGHILKGNSLLRSWLCATVPPVTSSPSQGGCRPMGSTPPPPLYMYSCSLSGHKVETRRHYVYRIYTSITLCNACFIMKNMFSHNSANISHTVHFMLFNFTFSTTFICQMHLLIILQILILFINLWSVNEIWCISID